MVDSFMWMLCVGWGYVVVGVWVVCFGGGGVVLHAVVDVRHMRSDTMTPPLFGYSLLFGYDRLVCLTHVRLVSRYYVSHMDMTDE